MAVRPDYNVGTISLVASSANFTTTGASLQTAAVQAGDAIITPSGHVLIIASITGQNGGTLFLPCPAGAAGTNLPLRIRFQPDGSRYQGAVRNLVDLLSSGNVEAFAALTGAAGKVPVFTGPGAMDLQDYIADPNGSLATLAALTEVDNLSELADLPLAARQILQTDENGALAQSDVTDFALTILAEDSSLAVRDALGATGNLFKVSYVTASGTFAYDSETKLAEVILIGGGGSGGGAGSAANNQATATPGGGAGGMAIRLIENPSPTASIMIGSGGATAGGAGGLSTAGNNGGNSTYTATGVSLTAGGGGGAPQTFGSQNVVAGAGGEGGGASGGHLNVNGQSGGGSFSMGAAALPSGVAVLSSAGDGGSGAYGSGGTGPKYSSAAAGQGIGRGGTGYGSGGSGSGRSLIVGNSTSGTGAPGLCIIKEYK